jgi:ketosteroid isomerase-like protein
MRRPRDTGRALSPENVEVVRRVYYTWNAGDITALRDLCAPDVVMHHPEGWPEPGPSAGREAVLRQWEQVRDAWTCDTLELVTDFITAAVRVVVRDAWRGTAEDPTRTWSSLASSLCGEQDHRHLLGPREALEAASTYSLCAAGSRPQWWIWPDIVAGLRRSVSASLAGPLHLAARTTEIRVARRDASD